VASGQQALDAALAEARSLLGELRTQAGPTIRAKAALNGVRTTVRAWFGSHRPPLLAIIGAEALKPIDRDFQWLLAAANRQTAKGKYISLVRGIVRQLAQLEPEHAAVFASGDKAFAAVSAPSFEHLVGDPRMQAILERRWNECEACVAAGAPLAAVVMIGGLLEGLLLARINQLGDKAPVFSANLAPRDKTARTKPISDWTLANFIAVAHELGWITSTVKDLGGAIRDYRNFIHPQREYSANLGLTAADARILWEIAKQMMTQILDGGTVLKTTLRRSGR